MNKGGIAVAVSAVVVVGTLAFVLSKKAKAEEELPEEPFDMVVTGLTAMGDKYSQGALVPWVFQANIRITNSTDRTMTKGIKCFATYGEYDPDDSATKWWERTLEDQVAKAVGSGVPWYKLTLGPGQGIDLVSPYYYINGWRELQQTYEWPNWPLGTFRAGVQKKYWCRVFDDKGNAGPVNSIGSALSQ